MSERAFLDLDAVFARALGDLNGLRVADLGCGGGRATRILAARGASVVGVDPNAAAVAEARTQGAGPDYIVAPAEASGLPSGGQDVALFSFSLHHVSDMAAALAEARRITRPGGRLAVLEPEAPDPMLPVMRLIDDESAAYARAKGAVAAAVSDGALERLDALAFAAKHRVETADAMVADLTAVDPRRRLGDADRAAFEAAFARAQERDAEGGYIPYWCRIDVLRRV